MAGKRTREAAVGSGSCRHHHGVGNGGSACWQHGWLIVYLAADAKAALTISRTRAPLPLENHHLFICPAPPWAQVEYQDKQARFSAVQLLAMLLVDLKLIAEAEGSPVSECVLAVPVYFTEPERHAMLAASQVRAMRCAAHRVARLAG